MKKLFLIIVMMALVGSSFAQDIYATGYYATGTKTRGALYKNGTRLYTVQGSNYSTKASKVTLNSKGDVYWMVDYYDPNDNIHHKEIRKNNEALSVPDGFQLKDFYCLNDTLYAVGQLYNSDSVMVGAVLQGDDFSPYWQIGDGIHQTYLNAADVDKRTGIPYFCGYITTDGTKQAAVWKENELHFVFQQQHPFDSVSCSVANEISVDNGLVFTNGYMDVDAGGWITLHAILKDNEYYVSCGLDSGYWKICAFAGEIYYIYDYPHGFVHDVVKIADGYGYQTMLSNFDGNYATNIYATPSDIYVCGKNEDKVCIWKNFEVFQQYDNNDNITNMAIDARSIDINNEWYYEIQNDYGSVTYQHLECQTDTVIENKRPKVIVRSNTQYDRNEITEVTHEYVYEENGKVYWWNKDLQEFTTLYDFGATQGEAWEIKVGYESIVMHVDSVGYYENEGERYRMLHVSDENGIFSGDIITGLGHLTSFFPEKLMNRDKDFRVEGLRCYWMNGVLILKIGEHDCDEVYDQYHLGMIETNTNGFAVYPNPANGVLVVETCHGASLPANAEYEIANMMGQTVMQGNIESENQQIDIANLPTGMYFLTVEGETVKFVKQ